MQFQINHIWQHSQQVDDMQIGHISWTDLLICCQFCVRVSFTTLRFLQNVIYQFLMQNIMPSYFCNTFALEIRMNFCISFTLEIRMNLCFTFPLEIRMNLFFSFVFEISYKNIFDIKIQFLISRIEIVISWIDIKNWIFDIKNSHF